MASSSLYSLAASVFRFVQVFGRDAFGLQFALPPSY
jgi:hypothetical protein